MFGSVDAEEIMDSTIGYSDLPATNVTTRGKFEKSLVNEALDFLVAYQSIHNPEVRAKIKNLVFSITTDQRSDFQKMNKNKS